LRTKFRKADKRTITKKEMAKNLSDRLGIDEQITSKIFVEFLDLIVDELKQGNKIEFRGTMILGTKIQAERQAQNPKTLEKITIPERRVAYFKKGDRLKGLD
jgi:integration host factor subunit beta